MAIGDDAIAAGMDIVDGATTPSNTIDTEINKSRDYIAQRTATVTPVAKGGTGATTAEGARQNLGLVKTITSANSAGKVPEYNANGQIAVATAASTGQAASWGQVQSALNGAKTTNASDLTSGTLGRPVNTSSTGRFNGGIYSDNARSSPVTGWLNVGVDGGGRLGQTGSSRRYKKDICDLEHDGDIDALQARQFEWIDYPGRTDVGVIAEEVADAGFEYLVVRDEDGEPMAVRYELLGVALLPVVQELRRRVAELEAGR